MIHNPFNNPKFAISMVVFFLLVATLFYDTSYQIANKVTDNLAATSISKTSTKVVNAKYCRDFSRSLSQRFTSASKRKVGLTTEDRINLEKCDKAGLLRSSVTSPTEGGGEGGLAGGSSCPGDFDSNMDVGQSDLDALISHWGETGGGQYDLTGNGVVNVDDLLRLLALWGPCPGSIPTNGLIGWYTLTPSIEDNSSYNNDATIQGISCTSSGCAFSGQVNQSVKADSMENDFNSSAGTVAMRVNPSYSQTTGIYHTLFTFDKDPNNTIEIWYSAANDLYKAHYVGNGIEKVIEFPYSSLPQNTWSHIALTWGSGDLKVYVNGSQVGSQSGIQTWSGLPVNAVFGNSSNNGQDPFNGTIKDVAVWTRALTSTEISTVANGTTPPPPPPGAVCGNGIIEGTEQCDGTNLGGLSCTSPAVGSFSGGTLSCNANTCTFNTSQCTVTPPPSGTPEIVVEWQNGTTWTNINDGATSAINFGSVTQNSTAPTRTFRIRNIGTANLTFGTVSVPTGYTVTSQPTSPVAPNGTATFVVRMNTGTQGTFPGQITFTNNDSNESTFNFAITGAVTGGSQTAGAEISVSWNNNGTYVDISDGQTSPVIDFGSITQGAAGPIIRFRIKNDAPPGAANLTFGTPTVPSGYSIVEFPTSPITPGNTSDLRVRLDSYLVGIKNGQITIPNTSDANEGTFNFEIIGVVVASGSTPPPPGTGPCTQIGSGNSISFQNCTRDSGLTFDLVNLNLSLNSVAINANSYGIYCNTCVTTNLYNTHIYSVGGPNQYAIRGNYNQWNSSYSSFENDGQKGVFRVYGLTNGSSYRDTFLVGRMFLGGGYSVESQAPYGPFQNFLFEETDIDVDYIDIFPNSNNIRFKNVDFHNTDHVSIWDGAHHIWFENATNLPRLRIGGTDYNNPCSLPSSLAGPPWYITASCN